MRRWESFGASEIGPSHIRTGKPNQDSWAAFHHAQADVLVVSDGVGSKDLSELGSEAACRAVDCALQLRLTRGETIVFDEAYARSYFLEAVRDAWLCDIAPLTPQEASATCLFAIRENGKIHLGMLGDGCVAVLHEDGSVRLLTESKDGGFSNITTSLSERVRSSDWLYMELAEDACEGVLLCTDGVADDIEDLEGFAAALIEEMRGLLAITAASTLSQMLMDWPTPKHSDDKTIACLLRREHTDGQ